MKQHRLKTIVFLNNILPYVTNNISKIILLSHVNEEFREALTYYCSILWKKYESSFYSQNNMLLPFPKSMENFSWIFLSLDKNTDIPWLLLCSRFSVQKFDQILSNCDDINKNGQGLNLLKKAIIKQRVGLIRSLIERNVDTTDILNFCLQLKVNSQDQQRGLRRIVLCLFSNIKDITMTNSLYETLLTRKNDKLTDMFFIEFGIKNYSKSFLYKYVVKIQNINTTNHDRISALHVAVDKEDKKLFDYLLGKNADVNVKNFKGLSPIFFTVCNNNLDMFEKLLERGADMSLIDDEGCNILHWAVSSEKTDFKMISKIVNIMPSLLSQEDKDGKKPSDWTEDENILSLLKESEKSACSLLSNTKKKSIK